MGGVDLEWSGPCSIRPGKIPKPVEDIPKTEFLLHSTNSFNTEVQDQHESRSGYVLINANEGEEYMRWKREEVAESSDNREIERSERVENIDNIQNEKKIVDSQKGTRQVGGGRPPEWPKMEERLCGLFLARRQEGLSVDRKWFNRYWKMIFEDEYPEQVEQIILGTKYACSFSDGWFERFKQGKSIVFRVGTTKAQKQPAELEHNILEFLKSVRRNTIPRPNEPTRDVGRYYLDCISNMDQLPLPFEILSGRTYDQKGMKFLRPPDMIAALLFSGLQVAVVMNNYVQPLDVVVNKLLKDLIRELIEEEVEKDLSRWYHPEQRKGMALGEYRILLTKCVDKAWERFHHERADSIRHAFQKVGLALPPNGSANDNISIADLPEITQIFGFHWMQGGLNCNLVNGKKTGSGVTTQDDWAETIRLLQANGGITKKTVKEGGEIGYEEIDGQEEIGSFIAANEE
ncbi:hypothetical protein C7212DRAFT_341013 [Tuber magnatum]|uniref:HTH CENPB-type domain-containing protein n=1 Tax=Tuber magnatum TaxID=42249 RepID=A0A317T2B9_9PEZI|nr:hypothetical protein C7212DRAFT_341013 [Tuber magnatum]